MDAMETRLVTPCRAEVSRREVAPKAAVTLMPLKRFPPARSEAPAAAWQWFGSQGTDHLGLSVALGGELTQNSKVWAVLLAGLLESLRWSH